MRLDLLAALSGVLIALQARANGELSHLLNNSIEAALVSFGSGLIIIAVISLFHPGIKRGIRNLHSAVKLKRIPRWRLFAGMLGGSFVALQTHIVPLVGVAIYSVAAIAGQTAVSLVVDRIGLTGGGVKHISPRRVLAAVVTVGAVFLSVLDRLDAANFAPWAVAFAVGAGALVGVQRALNGQINEFTEQSAATSYLNFIMGTSFLLVLLIVGTIINGDELAPLPSGPWWIYTGGVIGVIYIAFTSTIVQHLGVLTFTMFSVGGNLLGSLLIDIFSPSEGVHISWYLVAGICVTYIGVLINGASVQGKRLK
jgi:transporter family-2 protein